MKRALLVLAATACMAACGDPTAPNAGRETRDVGAQLSTTSGDGVILCDPLVDPNCEPPFEPLSPVKACLNMASSGAPRAVVLKQCGPAFVFP